MTTTPTADPVDDGPGFAALLRQLSRHFARLGPAAPEVDDLLLRWAAALPDRAPEPGWNGLAAHLLAALAAPSAGRATPAPLGDEPPVTTPGELRTLLRALAADFARDRAWLAERRALGLRADDGGGWASSSLADLLEAWEAWLGPTPGGPPVEPVTWASIARQLGAARVYE
ncbi:hypothetical protein ACFV6F_08015 [Kitasatospora phosalacinea]|uniref:hypothetical protein n=1 Tax=Kitasatospora phosalacinea TaxID=2065 RepID=UPI00364B53DC